jgi:hypothetical protein
MANRNYERLRFEQVFERLRTGQQTFDPDYVVFARKLALLGLSRSEIARNLGTDRSMFESWVLAYPEFRRALDEGMVIGDYAVVEGLHKRCTGYTARERKFVGGNMTEEREVHIPPDWTACRYWLVNRQPDLWKAEGRIEVGGPSYGDLNARPVEYPKKDPEKEPAQEPAKDAAPTAAP